MTHGKTFDEILDREIDEAERKRSVLVDDPGLLFGEGFVMTKPAAPREVWPGIENEIGELEMLLK